MIARVPDAIQSALHPRGPAAEAIAEIAWVLFSGGFAIFLLVLALAGWALWAPPERRRWLSSRRSVVAGGIVLPVTVLTALLAHTVLFKSPERFVPGVDALRIEVIGHQWWWRVNYLGEAGTVDFETANEIRIPVGRPVELTLRSADVLHSFWVPNLAGKVDMVPGRANFLRLAARQPGTFRGQCAEYCGGPHALMALYVVAEESARFEQWREAQRKPARSADPLFAARCAACHSIRGTPAAGRLGPDLTHVGSRLSIGAGVLPTGAQTLAHWIASSQHLKPGNLMPSIDDLSPEDLRKLAAYLEGLR